MPLNNRHVVLGTPEIHFNHCFLIVFDPWINKLEAFWHCERQTSDLYQLSNMFVYASVSRVCQFVFIIKRIMDETVYVQFYYRHAKMLSSAKQGHHRRTCMSQVWTPSNNIFNNLVGFFFGRLVKDKLLLTKGRPTVTGLWKSGIKPWLYLSFIFPFERRHKASDFKLITRQQVRVMFFIWIFIKNLLNL